MTRFDRTKNRLARFQKDEAGNVAILTALVLLPVIVFACGSVDVIRMTSTKQRLQAVLDSATLAAASLTNEKEMTATVADYIATNTPDGEPWDTLVYSSEALSDSLNAREMKITASVTVETPFLSLIGTPEATISAESIAIQSASNIEISMVLDISSSMKGDKVANLRTAAKDFLDLMLDDANIDYTSINLVLFGGTVNIGDSLYSRYVNAAASAITNPDEVDYYVEEDVPFKGFLFDNGNTCIEYTTDDYDLDDIPLASRPQLPHFTRYGAKNDWCPRSDTESMFNTNDLKALKERIDEMTLSDGTGMDIGTMWGAKALSPKLKSVLGGDFSDRPAAFDDEDTLKIAVIMTDGEITNQTRPRDPDHESQVHIGEADVRQTIVKVGDKDTSSSEDEKSIAYFKRMCEDMKAQGVQIYTIGFQINTANVSNHLLEYCASTPTDYYYVEGLNLEDAFNSIAASVNSLRISG